MTDIEKRAESSVTFQKFGEGMDEKDVFLHNILMQGRREGYIRGATEQKTLDIDKVCEWLKVRNVLTDASLEGFRKAMED